MSGNPPAGYYTDPSIPGYIRYWDGDAWIPGTSRPAPQETGGSAGLADSYQDVIAQATGGDAGGGSAVGSAVGGAWRPEPAGDPGGLSAGQAGAVGSGASAVLEASQGSQVQQSYEQPVAQQFDQPYEQSVVQQFDQQVMPQQYEQPVVQQFDQPYEQSVVQQFEQPVAQPVVEQYEQPVVQQVVPEQFQQQYVPQQHEAQPAPQPYEQQAVEQIRQQIPQQFQQPEFQQPAPQQYQQPAASAPQIPQQYQPAAQPAHPAVEAPAAPQRPESVAAMVVPSAFTARSAAGGYAYGQANPFAGLPGSFDDSPDESESEGETTVLELATPGSRLLARIIDLGIAAVFSAPVTVSLLLVAHRHDHQYVLELDAQATTTYTTLGMDGVGIALWGGALAALLLAAIVYEGYRLGRGGQTAGKRLAGIRVVRLADAHPMRGGGLGIRRALLFWVLAVLPLIDLLALGGVLWGRPYRQGLHERVTATATVKA